MLKWEKTLLILGVVVMATTPVFMHYANPPPPVALPATQPVVEVSPQQARNILADDRYNACVKAVNTSHEVAWEINCENLNEGAAEKYNACVTNTALSKKISTAPQSCQTNCILPREIAKPLIDRRDAAKARCLKDMKAMIEK